MDMSLERIPLARDLPRNALVFLWLPFLASHPQLRLPRGRLTLGALALLCFPTMALIWI
jgi:hypothetical protein